ncbi:MAG: carboxypeptidase-like regulatory domain-containing protein [Bacteroidota bacterium]|nr:carboxypeptidase-like regulatory domain-containing protein [Bacteroidota bacterium]
MNKNGPKYLVLLLFLSIAFSLCGKVAAQLPFDKKYSFNFRQITLGSAIDSLRKKVVAYGFSYNPDILPQQKKLNCVFFNQPLKLILDSLLSPCSLTYKLVANNVVIIRQSVKDEKQTAIADDIPRDTIIMIHVRGQVIDRKTKEPVAFGSIYIRNRNIGTMSNENGRFILKIPSACVDDSVYFSCVGYKTLARKANDLISGEATILLEPIIFHLKEVTVKVVKPEEILKQAINQIPKNYSTIPLMLTAFYREIIQQNKDYVSLSEAVLHIKKAPYNNFANDQVVIFQGRKCKFPKQMDTVVLKFQGGIHTNLMLDLAKNHSNFLADDYFQYYDFKLYDIIDLHERPTYVISFDQKDNIRYALFKGNLFIDKATMAIVRADFMLSPKGIDQAAELLVQRTSRRIKVWPTYAKYLVNYTLHNNTWFLNYIHEEVEFKVHKRFTFYKTTFKSMAEMVITQTDSSNIQHFDNKNLIRYRDIFVEKVGKYNPDFWGDFNFIPPDSSIEEALRRFDLKKVSHEAVTQ